MSRFWIISFGLLLLGDLSLGADKVPVYNPSLPYVGEIPDDLFHGGSIRIRGFVKNYIEVNLSPTSKPQPEGDVNLHIAIRYNEKVIVRSSRINSMWDVEERYGGFPIGPNDYLEISILAKEHNFEIALNGRHFCEFVHRRPLDTSRYLHISGDMEVESITTDFNKCGVVVPASLIRISC